MKRNRDLASPIHHPRATMRPSWSVHNSPYPLIACDGNSRRAKDPEYRGEQSTVKGFREVLSPPVLCFFQFEIIIIERTTLQHPHDKRRKVGPQMPDVTPRSQSTIFRAPTCIDRRSYKKEKPHCAASYCGLGLANFDRLVSLALLKLDEFAVPETLSVDKCLHVSLLLLP